jgi:translation initiation factor 1 (eIF-1/SUI1)
MVDRTTRLVYSTGGEKEPESAPEEHPRARRVSVSLERRPSGRVVTLVKGLPAHETKDAAAALKTLLSTGGTVKAATLELQGDHQKRVSEWLAGRARGKGGR